VTRVRAARSPRRRVRAAALMAAALVAGCAGDATSVLTTSGEVAPGSRLMTASADAGARAPAFSPFSDTPGEPPRREVIAHPTRAEIMTPGAIPEFSIGRADAPVTIIKYMSLTCPYCRRFQAETFPVLKREYIDRGQVRLILREFPIGKASGTATIALRCAPMDKYLALYEKFLQQQSAWVAQEVKADAIFKVAQQVGLTREQFDACLKDEALIGALRDIKDRGRQLGVIGTPNFFVETRLLKTVVGIAELRELIDPLLKGR